jgi:hypothetical protein
VWHLDEISIILNWIFYLVFAFSRWPVSGNHAPHVEGPRPTEAFRVNTGPASAPPTPGGALPTARSVPMSAASPGSGPAGVPTSSAPKGPNAQFCGWCGESLPGNRALFHDCGPKDRPDSFCKRCGTALPAGTSECSSCGLA